MHVHWLRRHLAVRFEKYIFGIFSLLLHTYAASNYCWNTMSLTPIGYGNTIPGRCEDYIFGILISAPPRHLGRLQVYPGGEVGFVICPVL